MVPDNLAAATILVANIIDHVGDCQFKPTSGRVVALAGACTCIKGIADGQMRSLASTRRRLALGQGQPTGRIRNLAGRAPRV